MPGEVQEAVYVGVEGEAQLGGNAETDCNGHQPVDVGVQRLPAPVQQNQGRRQDGADDVFARYFESGQPLAVDVASGKYVPGKYGEEQRTRDQRQSRGHPRRPKAAAEQQREGQQAQRLDIARRNPKLGGPVGVPLLKDPHALVGQGVQQVQKSDERQ